MMDMYALLMGGSGGGGGGLPVPTLADNGKSLVATAIPDESNIIVPEQTATLDLEFYNYILSDGDASKFTHGTAVFVTIGDKTELTTVFDDDGYIVARCSMGEVGLWEGAFSALVNADPAPETETFKVTGAKIEYTLKQTTFVCNIDNSTGNMNRTWKEVYDALANGESVVGVEIVSDTAVNQYLIKKALYNAQTYRYEIVDQVNVKWYASTQDELLMADDW